MTFGLVTCNFGTNHIGSMIHNDITMICMVLDKPNGPKVVPSDLPDYGSPERSGKMKVVREVLRMWHLQHQRCLLFCQTRQMLDIIERFVINEGYTYRRS